MSLDGQNIDGFSTALSGLNAQQAKSVSADITSEKDKKLAELDALDKKYEGTGDW